jgi:hypothetical protein
MLSRKWHIFVSLAFDVKNTFKLSILELINSDRIFTLVVPFRINELVKTFMITYIAGIA